MAKLYQRQARDSKSEASRAFADGDRVRVYRLEIDPVTHKAVERESFTMRGDGVKTLHRAVQEKFGITRDQLVYEILGK